MPKKIVRKVRIGKKILRQEGLAGFLIIGLQRVQKKTRHTESNKVEIYTKAEYNDILAADPKNPPLRWLGTNKTKLKFNWVMPPPGKGSGGHMTLFRFIKALEETGHECQIYLYSPENRATIAQVQATMGDSFPKLRASMKWLREDGDLESADAIFATSWETAYPVYNSSLNAKRFYFVQDFEPYFYPVGSLSSLAENTYKFGFYGITAGRWLATKLKDEYGMETSPFDFGADSNVYHLDNTKTRKEILFYARPYTERRGFEMGVMALDLFHRKHPDYVINFFGYDTSDYDLPFPYNDLGILEHEEINKLYNRCAAGLVMSLTNMSLLPLELLSSGAIPVVNEGANNRLVSNNKFIAFAPNDPISLASELSRVVSKPGLGKYAQAAAESVKADDWEESSNQFVKVVERETRGGK
jgi:glycosyltransferase involved in cell wall biosynthesis